MLPAGLLTETIKVYRRETEDTGKGSFKETYTFLLETRAQIMRLNGGIGLRNDLQVNRYDIGFRTRFLDVKARDKIEYNGEFFFVDYIEPYPLRRGLNLYCFADTQR